MAGRENATIPSAIDAATSFANAGSEARTASRSLVSTAGSMRTAGILVSRRIAIDREWTPPSSSPIRETRIAWIDSASRRPMGECVVGVP